MTEKNIDQVSLLKDRKAQELRFGLHCVNPMDAKYRGKVGTLVETYLSPDAELRANALVQYTLLETLGEYGIVPQQNVEEAKKALQKIDPLNIALLEDNVTQHDQLAVLVEFSRHISPETQAYMHPGTTSYDVVDTSRAFLFKGAWKEYIEPATKNLILKLAELSTEYLDVVQIGRTHLQYTSPIIFGGYLSAITRRLAEEYKLIDDSFNNLKGKISGIVGTGAGVSQFVENDIEFEKKVLEKLGLQPEFCLSQTTSKESYLHVGQAISGFTGVLCKFANDMRLLYSSDINEVVSRKVRVGGSSTDAFKDNPINWENIAGTYAIINGELSVLEAMVQTDLQRHLSDSKQGRYEPQGMMTNFYEMVLRTNKALETFSINEDKMKEHLVHFEKVPSEAMVTILKSHGFKTNKHANAHDFVKEISTKVKMGKGTLLELALEHEEFKELYDTKLSQKQISTLNGDYNHYLGSAKERAKINIAGAIDILGGASLWKKNI